MTRFMDKSFSVQCGGDQQYRDNWEQTFRKDKESQEIRESQMDKKTAPEDVPQRPVCSVCSCGLLCPMCD